MSQRFVAYETVDYVVTVNKALSDARERRAQLSRESKSRFESSLERYFWAVDSLYTILIPRLRTERMRDLRMKALQAKGFEKLKYLDELLSEILVILDKAGLLIRGERIEVEE